jgi:broad specificity phosphatase PhoE
VGHPLTRLILVRHGVTEWNEGGRFQGHQDVPLAEMGRRQAERVAWRLRRERIANAFSSDLQRARETAQIVLRGRDTPLVCTDGLREMSFGAWEGLRADEISQKYPEDWAQWVLDAASGLPSGGGESLAMLQERIVAFYRTAVETTEGNTSQPAWFSSRTSGRPSPEQRRTILMVSHGGVIRVLLAHLLEMPLGSYWRFSIRPASVSIFDLYPQGAIADVIGETAHLADLRTQHRARRRS